jgi:hypothetical protein
MYMYLAKTTTWNQFLFITYIITMKRANPIKRICPSAKYDITNNLRSQKPAIHSRYLQTTLIKKAEPLLTLPYGIKHSNNPMIHHYLRDHTAKPLPPPLG